MGFEESLIRNAAPTLAGIKVASLYNYSFPNMTECEQIITSMNHQLNHKGVYIELMNHKDDFYLIYVYRKTQLRLLLDDRDISSFLGEYGYLNESGGDVAGYVGTLKERIKSNVCFPHEVGVFLGYPLDDVRDFIRRKGEGCVLCGDWKVYHDAQKAMCFFCKLKKCRDVYLKTYIGGRNLYDMTVSA